MGGLRGVGGAVEAAASLAAMGLDAEAITVCGGAIEEHRGGAREAYARRAASYEAVGEHGRALRDCQKALGGRLAEPAARDAEVMCGRLYILLGRAAKAANHFAKARGKYGDPEILAYRALAMVLDDRHDKALETLAGEAGAAEGHPATLAVAARALYETGRHEEAAERCDAARGAGAPCPAAWLYAGMAHDALGNAAEASRAYGTVGSCAAPDTDLTTSAGVLGRAYALCRTGMHERAAGLLLPSGTAAAPVTAVGALDSAAKSCIAGMALAKAGQGEEASPHFKSAAASGPANSDGLYYAGLASYMLGRAGEERRYADAVRLLKLALSKNKKSGRAADLEKRVRESMRAAAKRANAGRAIRAAKGAGVHAAAAKRANAGRAIRAASQSAVQRAAGAAPAQRNGHDQRAALRRRQEQARQDERRARDEATRNEAVRLSGVGRFEDALDWFGALGRLPQDDSEGWAAKSAALYGLGRYEEAAECAKKAHPADPCHQDVLVAAAACDVQLGRRGQYGGGQGAKRHYDTALYRIKKIRSGEPNHHEALALGGLVHAYSVNMKDMPDTSESTACRLLANACRTDFDDAAVLYHAGRLREGEDPRSAAEFYRRAAACRPRRLEDYECAGRALDALGMFGEARARYMTWMSINGEYSGLYGEIMKHGTAAGRPPYGGSGDVAVVDTNIAMPCLVYLCTGRLANLEDDAAERLADRLFGGGPEAGRAVIPRPCAREIKGNLRRYVDDNLLSSAYSDISYKVGAELERMPTEQELGIRVGYDDSLAVMKTYWTAWLDMGDAKKRAWQDRKKGWVRPGTDRRAPVGTGYRGGGPPAGPADIKVLAIAAKIAGKERRAVTLYTRDSDFLQFKKHIAGLGVIVRDK